MMRNVASGIIFQVIKAVGSLLSWPGLAFSLLSKIALMPHAIYYYKIFGKPAIGRRFGA
jgi:hypothetical protein